MQKKKGPFVNYTPEQIFLSESVLYIIQVGPEVFEVNGQWFFAKKSATTYYNRIIKELLNQLHNGTNKQKNRAKKLLTDVKIVPLRMQ